MQICEPTGGMEFPPVLIKSLNDPLLSQYPISQKDIDPESAGSCDPKHTLSCPVFLRSNRDDGNVENSLTRSCFIIPSIQ